MTQVFEFLNFSVCDCSSIQELFSHCHSVLFQVKVLRVALQRVAVALFKPQIAPSSSYCRSKLTQKFVFVLHQAAAYCHSTVYSSKVGAMPNYNQMPSVATGCCKNPGSFLVENAILASLWPTNLIPEHVPVTLPTCKFLISNLWSKSCTCPLCHTGSTSCPDHKQLCHGIECPSHHNPQMPLYLEFIGLFHYMPLIC